MTRAFDVVWSRRGGILRHTAEPWNWIDHYTAVKVMWAEMQVLLYGTPHKNPKYLKGQMKNLEAALGHLGDDHSEAEWEYCIRRAAMTFVNTTVGQATGNDLD